jgi:hypothetical protein
MALLSAINATDSTAASALDDCSAEVCCEGSSTCGAEQILLQKTQTRLASTVSHSEQQSKSVADVPSSKASKVPLSEEGYKIVAKLKDEREMGVFVKRVADELGYQIADEGSLNGVLPYYSGKKATQSFVALTSELSKTSKQRKGWAKKVSLPTAKGSEQILLQESHRVVSSRPRASLMESRRMTAKEVPLSEEGYKTVVELKDNHEMAHFIKRVAEEHGYEIADAGSLSGVVPYYSGKKATQSFVALAAELGRTSKNRKGWAKKTRRTSTITPAQVLLQESQRVIAKPASPMSKPKDIGTQAMKSKAPNTKAEESKLKATTAPLTEEGYKMIAKLKEDREMSLFVKRVADELGYEISDVGSLNGVVPYYSGKKATQSFMALKNEFSRTAKQAKGWAKTAGKTTQEKKPPKTTMIEKKDENIREVKAAHSSAPKQGKGNVSAAKAQKKKAATN